MSDASTSPAAPTVLGDRARFLLLTVVLFCLSSIWANVLAFNFAVICMHRHHVADNSTTLAPDHHENDIILSGAQKTQLILAVAVGALLAQNGVVSLVSRFGVRVVFTALGLLSAAATLATPAASRLGFYPFVGVRLLLGVAFAANFPVIGVFTNRWGYWKQNGLFVSVLVSHLQVGTAFSMPSSGYICANYDWPLVYYGHGLVGILLFLLFAVVHRNNPHKHPMLGDVEREKIARCKAPISKSTERDIPVSAIVRTKSVWAIWAAAVGCFSAANIFFLYGPTFMHSVLELEVASTGLSATLPPLAQFTLKLAAGLLSDKITGWSETAKLKIFNTVSLVGAAVFYVLLGVFARLGYTRLAIGCFALGVGSLGVAGGGFFKAAPLLARQFSGFVMGHVATAFCLAQVVDSVLGGLVASGNTKNQWLIVFTVIAAILLTATTIFGLFASGDPADWTKTGDSACNSTPHNQQGNNARVHPEHDDGSGTESRPREGFA